MVSRRPTNSKSSQNLIVAILVVLGVSAITYGVLRINGFFGGNVASKPKEKSREGLIPIPKSQNNLYAFDKVQREDVYDREIGNDSYFWLSPEQVKRNPDWVTSIDQVVGRVMARNKRADFVFKKSDFLPEGSRTGLMGGVPEGKQGFFLGADKIPGLRFLKKGDRFDLLVNLPEESENSSAEYGLMMGGVKAQAGKPIPVNGIRHLVQGGELVALTTNKTMTTQGGLNLETKDKNGKEIKTGQKEERVLIAIAPQESVPLTDALGNDLQIHMVVQSGQKAYDVDPQKALDGMIAFPANAIKIDAFAKIKAGDLAEPANGELRRYYFKADKVKDEWIPRVEELIGKVVARDIEPGYIFSSADFLSPGHLVNDVDAFAVLSATDLVDGESSEWVGKVAARNLKAGKKLDASSILASGSLVQDVESFGVLTASDLVDGTRSTWLGKVVKTDLGAGHALTESDLLPENSLFKDVKAFHRLGAGDLVNGIGSDLVGKYVRNDLQAGQLINEKDLLSKDSAVNEVKAFEELKANDLAGGIDSSWLGRILAVNIDAGQLVKEDMLLVEGSRPGISGAIPKGRVALVLSAKSASGLDRLSRGDRIDLVESSDFSLSKTLGNVVVSNRVANSLEKTVNKVIARDVLIIDVANEQVVVAISTSEVSPVNIALAKEKKQVMAVTRAESQGSKPEKSTGSQSNKDTQTNSEIQSDPNPLDSIIVTKVIIDGKETERAFRRSQK